MRMKRIFFFLALAFFISARSLPMTAFAADDDPPAPSEIMEEDVPVPEGAFTPEGAGTVLDKAADENGDKQFYTITTESGQVFYLIIDGRRDINNVYFLKRVTETDLMAFVEEIPDYVSGIPAAETCICIDLCEAGEVNTNCSLCEKNRKNCTGKAVLSDEPERPGEPAQNNKDTGKAGGVLVILIGMIVVAGTGYYVKILRPKQPKEEEEEYYGEGFDPGEAYGRPEYLLEEDPDDGAMEEDR